MSHMKKIKVKIKSLECLSEAAKALGLTLEAATEYRWFGRFVGDTPMPEGFTEKELGKCLFKITSGKEQMYEVGVVRSKTHDGYELIYDYWMEGKGLEKIIGKGAVNLVQRYSAEVIKRQMIIQGMNVEIEEVGDNLRVVARGQA